MTPEQLAEIRARLDAATPGPWHEHNPSGYEHTRGGYVSASSVRHEGPSICDIYGNHGQPHAANRALIAHAPSDMRALLDEVDRLTADRDRLTEALRPFADEAGDWWEKWADDHVLQVCAGIGYSPHDSSFTVGDLRRARAALTSNT